MVVYEFILLLYNASNGNNKFIHFCSIDQSKCGYRRNECSNQHWNKTGGEIFYSLLCDAVFPCGEISQDTYGYNEWKKQEYKPKPYFDLCEIWRKRNTV